MTWLTSLSTGTVLALCILSTLFISAISLLLLIKLEHGGSEIAGMTAAAYMTALGSLFAILTGFLINSEYLTLRETQRAISTEVAAQSVLAYASASLPPPETYRIQALLSKYARALIDSEWRALAIDDETQSTAFDALGDLQLEIADLSSRPSAPDAPMTSMGSALEAMTAARRQRVSVASQTLPMPLLALSVISGLALIINALVIALRAGPKYGFVALGIIALVALDIAAVIAISAPFRGPFVASTTPIEQILREITSGAFLPWIAR